MKLEPSRDEPRDRVDTGALAECASRRKQHSLKNDSYSTAYKLFRRRIIQRSRRGPPAASTPLSTRGQQSTSFMLDSVRQRLRLIDSPPRDFLDTDPLVRESEARAHCGGTARHKAAGTPPCATISPRPPQREKAFKPILVWSTDEEDDKDTQKTGPFSVLHTGAQPQSQSQMSLAAPSLLDDYYTDLLDCSCHGVLALALGSSVYLWNSEARSLVGRLTPSPSSGAAGSHGQSVLSVRWSGDGRGLCVGNRRGSVELWDVEQGFGVRRVLAHQSAVRALSWKQNIVSSGSDLGQIRHCDPRDSRDWVGTASQEGGVCSLQWSEDDLLASGSTEGLLLVWDGLSTKQGHSPGPVSTMRLRSSAKAVGWCPWQSNVIATGGGWKDGEVRVWDIRSGACLSSVQTDSQVCCLRWSDEQRQLVTGHGAPHHHISSWSWDSSALAQTKQLSGHSKRVLHLALNHKGSRIFTAGADQSMQVWDI